MRQARGTGAAVLEPSHQLGNVGGGRDLEKLPDDPDYEFIRRKLRDTQI